MLKIKYVTILLGAIALLLNSCQCKNDDNDLKLPIHLSEPLKSHAYYSPDEMMYVYSYVSNVYPLGKDSIQLSGDYGYDSLKKFLLDKSVNYDSVPFTTKGLKIVVDTKNELNMLREPFGHIFETPVVEDYDFRTANEKLRDSIEYEIKVKFSEHSKIYYRAYPIYIINTSYSVHNINLKGNEMYLVVEALNESREWKAITMTTAGNCIPDNILSIHPQHYALGKTLKFHGSFKTQLRIKMAVGSEIIYSDPFKGFINKNQFKEPEDFQYHTILNRK